MVGECKAKEFRARKSNLHSSLMFESMSVCSYRCVRDVWVRQVGGLGFGEVAGRWEL